METLHQALNLRSSVHDKTRRDVVLDMTDLMVEDRIDPDHFFSENYITTGMKSLYEAVFRRLEGHDQDGVFRLTQSMGGGKTHNMIAVGLLGRFAEYRKQVMGQVYETSVKGAVKVIAFSGREKPATGIWGFIAEQLGKKDLFKEFYSPLQAPGQSAWMNLLKGEKLILLLDELPPYLFGGSGTAIGSSNLGDVTTEALVNLMAALGKPELNNVALVLSDLGETGADGSNYSCAALSNLRAELNRLARNFTPVAQTGDELYHILRTRLFSNVPSEEVIKVVADAYAEKIKEAKQMDISTETPDSMRKEIMTSYPFHPGLKNLYARFKENLGFQQTRGLIRLMRVVCSRMFDEEQGWAKSTYLIAPYDLDLADPDLLTEIEQINGKLTNAIAHDIYSSNESAVAQDLDERFQNDLSSKAAKLVLMSSLANVQNAIRGLKDTEIVNVLVAPGTDVRQIKSDIIPELRSNAWYLHQDASGKFLFKDVENVVAKLSSYMRGYNEESKRKEIKAKLQEIFHPTIGDCYQQVFALPSLDELDPEVNKLQLVIYQPHPGGLHPDLEGLYENTPYKNRLLFLSGDQLGMESIHENAAGLKAIETIISEFRSEGVPPNDSQYMEAERLKENYQFKFRQSVVETFVKLYFPTKNGLMDATLRFRFENNELRGEEQIKKTLEDKRKYLADDGSDTFKTMVEQRLFISKSERWNDVKKRAAQSIEFVWHRPNALEQLKDRMLQQDQWRANGDWIEKGPFPPPPTSVQIREVNRDEETGEVTLRVNPLHGDTVHWEVGEKVTTASSTVDLGETFSTKDMKLSFLCVDSKGKAETGNVFLWQNRVTVRKGVFTGADGKPLFELKAAPADATIYYSTTGSNPFDNGGVYEGPFAVEPNERITYGAELDGIRSSVDMHKVPPKDRKWTIDPVKPATWLKAPKADRTADTFRLLGQVEKNELIAQDVSIDIEKSNEEYVGINFDRKTQLDHKKLSEGVAYLQSLMDGEVRLSIKQLHFANGQLLLDYLQEEKLELPEQAHVRQD